MREADLAVDMAVDTGVASVIRAATLGAISDTGGMSGVWAISGACVTSAASTISVVFTMEGPSCDLAGGHGGGMTPASLPRRRLFTTILAPDVITVTIPLASTFPAPRIR